MACASVLRRSASSIAPLAIRRFGTIQRSHQSSALLFSAVKHGGVSHQLHRSPFPSFHHYSTAKPKSDEVLLQVIDSEIQCADETDGEKEVVEVPKGFPFEIQDNSGEQTVTLTRKYNGETISVEVYMPDLLNGEDDDDGDNDDDGDDNIESGNQSTISLVVRVSKNGGPCLEFGCTAYADQINIDSLSMKDPNSSDDQIAYEGPDFGDLDENLQKGLHKYLDVRGITPDATNFMHEYMVNKDSREYKMWLKNLKEFVEA